MDLNADICASLFVKKTGCQSVQAFVNYIFCLLKICVLNAKGSLFESVPNQENIKGCARKGIQCKIYVKLNIQSPG